MKRFSRRTGLIRRTKLERRYFVRRNVTDHCQLAIEVPGAIVIQIAEWHSNELILETYCRDYEHYTQLPDVVVYQNVECGKTGWSSDRQYACYKSGVAIAHVKT